MSVHLYLHYDTNSKLTCFKHESVYYICTLLIWFGGRTVTSPVHRMCIVSRCGLLDLHFFYFARVNALPEVGKLASTCARQE